MRKKSLDTIYELAKNNNKILFIGSDLGPGVLDNLKINYPKQFLMEGVSEQHIIGMASGLAMEGFIPYVNTIGTFLTRRCFEQIAMDLCLHDLPVRLIANGGGVVYAPLGPTHLAIEDIAIMKTLPNMTIVVPCDAVEMEKIILSSENWPHPIYIRVAKGGDEIITSKDSQFTFGKAVIFKNPKDGLFVTTGIMTQKALKACQILEEHKIDCGVLHVNTIKPLDEITTLDLISKVKAIVTVEEHIRSGGLGSSILELCNDKTNFDLKQIMRIGLPDKFPDQYGSQDSLLSYLGIDEKIMVKSMMKLLGT